MRRLIVLLLGLCVLGWLASSSFGSTPAAAAPTVHTEASAAVASPVAVPEPSAQAVRYYRSGNVIWTIATLWGLLVPALILFSGLSARMRQWAQRLGKYWYLTLVIYFVLFMLLTTALNLPIEYYSGFVRPHNYGMSSQALSKWIHDELIGLGLGLAGGALLLWIPYLLLKRSPRRWWLYTWLASIPLMLFLAFVQPIWIAPLFNHFGPMQDKALESQILAEAHRAGIESARVFEVDKSTDTNALNAYVDGIGGSTRIVLWDTLIKRLDPKQLLFVLGHEMGHYVLGHIWRSLILGSLFLLAGLWLIHRSAGWALRRFGSRFGFSELGDVASLPLLMLIFGIFAFVLTPVLLAYSRHQEHEADRFGLEITRDNHACATSFVALSEQNLGYPRPGLLYKIWRSSHPPLGERIDFCNSYHPWLNGGSGEYAGYFTAPPPPDQH